MADNDLEKKWYDLHIELVNKVISFCKENNLKDITDVSLNIDCVDGSVGQGEWTAATDSSFIAMKRDTVRELPLPKVRGFLFRR